MKIVTLVGSRNIPPYIARLCNIIGGSLSSEGYIARSGGASGCDTEFLRYYDPNLTEVYIPWFGFSDGILLSDCKFAEAKDILNSVIDIRGLKKSVLKLFTRNVFQVLGSDLNRPSDAMLFYAPIGANGVPTGGTRIAWLVAKKYNIKIVDITRYKHLVEYNKFNF